MSEKLEFGVIGLGRMGGNLARQALEKQIKVAGFTQGKIEDDLIKMGLIAFRSIEELRNELSKPRAIFLYIPSGPAVDILLNQLSSVLEKGDIIVDGGNSYWGDSIRRAGALKAKGIFLVDLGTSGGVEGARHGACFMAGGEAEAIKRIEPILLKLAVKDGYAHTGPPGSGHFTKLVHNGIEFGMLQAIGEGIDILEHYHERLDIADILKCWRNGSVIRSWLIDLMEDQLRKQKGLESIPAYIEDTGEVNWLIADALRMEVPVPVISLAVNQLFASRDDKKYWARSIAMMRHGFGGHTFGANEAIARERKEGKVGEIYRGKEGDKKDG